MQRYEWETIPSFAEALKAENTRYHSPEFFSSCTWDFWQFQYCRSGLYDEQLSRYFALFDRTQFHILTLAELGKEPLRTTESILRVLDLDPEPAKIFDFTVQHEGAHPFGRLHRADSSEPWDEESDDIMSEAFDGVIERTEKLVGRRLDWSL
jgi:hypothetical protein